MILVDSSVWIDFFNGRDTSETDKLDGWLGQEPILTGDLILTEVLQGFRDQKVQKKAQEALEELFYADMVGRDVALQSAQNYRFLRSKGVTVRKTIDVIIGTFCIMNAHSILQADRDFKPLISFLNLKTV